MAYKIRNVYRKNQIQDVLDKSDNIYGVKIRLSSGKTGEHSNYMTISKSEAKKIQNILTK